jgi:ribosomal protein S27AE
VSWTPGTWRRWLFGPTRIKGAAVVCPQCGAGMSIGGGTRFGSCHTIAADGTVRPSVVCPRCPWHTFIRLLDWPRARTGAIA